MALALLLGITALVQCDFVYAAQFSYDRSSAYGPDRWATITVGATTPFAGCASGSQSPISLTFDATHGSSFAGMARVDLRSNEQVPRRILLTNNGAFVALGFGDSAASTMRDPTNTASSATYTLAAAEFHSPAEHNFAGSYFDAELQIQFTGDGDAAAETRRISVAVPLKATPYGHNVELQKLFDGVEWPRLSNAAVPSTTTNTSAFEQDTSLAAAFRLSRLFPAAADYATYDGSLTSPPCTRGVRHIVMITPITMSGAQLAFLRALVGQSTPSISRLPSSSDVMLGNNRPAQSSTAQVRWFRSAGNTANFEVLSTGTGHSSKALTYSIVAIVISALGFLANALAVRGLRAMVARLANSVAEVSVVPGAGAANSVSEGLTVTTKKDPNASAATTSITATPRNKKTQ
jgi:carbonic anhydrase